MTDYEESTIEVLLQRLDEQLPPPSYAHPGDAGADLYSAIDALVEPGARLLVPTGVAIALPRGYVGFIQPRSGLALRHGIGLVNSPGTIDAGYRGQIKVLLINHDQTEPFHLRRGDRIAQLVIQQLVQADFIEVQNLPGSHRGEGGFGSTGVQ